MADADHFAQLRREGGAAFPLTTPLFDAHGTILHHDVYHGMTLRDWFAGMAMSQLAARFGAEDYDDIAGKAYQLADAMLKRRAEDQKARKKA